VLLEALGRLARDEPAVAARLRLVLAGRLDAAEQDLIAAHDLGDVVRHVGHLSRADSLALQRRGDVLVLITSADLSWELPGKLFEYLGAGRPILALAQDNEAARVIAETGAGTLVAPGDAEAVAAALRRIAQGDLPPAPDTAAVARFAYPGPAEAMAGQIEAAMARRKRVASAG
jgi:glycosyltransferase involved in cell wall biosynthesis